MVSCVVLTDDGKFLDKVITRLCRPFIKSKRFAKIRKLGNKLFLFCLRLASFPDPGINGILKWIEGDHSGHWLGFLTRDVMENATSFQEAFNLLSNSKMLAPAYFILGGNSSSQVREKCLQERKQKE